MSIAVTPDPDVVSVVEEEVSPADAPERDLISISGADVTLGIVGGPVGEIALGLPDAQEVPAIIEQQLVSVVEPEFSLSVLELSVAGPKGDPGTASLVTDATAGVPLGGHRFVIIDTSGNAVYADPTDLSHFHRVVGITTGAVGAGDTASIRVLGELEEPSWNWVVGSPVYLGLSGVPTQVLPPTAVFMQVVGFPVNQTTLYIKLREPIQLV